MRHPRRGVTLLELVVVLAVLVALAVLVVPLLSESSKGANETVTRTNLNQVRDAITRYRLDMDKRLPRPGYTGLNGSPVRPDRPQLRYLYVNPGRLDPPGDPETSVPTYDPVAAKGWRGPYAQAGFGTYQVATDRGFATDYGETGDPCVVDGWNNPIVIVENATALPPTAELRSAGPDGILMTADDIVLSLY